MAKSGLSGFVPLCRCPWVFLLSQLRVSCRPFGSGVLLSFTCVARVQILLFGIGSILYLESKWPHCCHTRLKEVPQKMVVVQFSSYLVTVSGLRDVPGWTLLASFAVGRLISQTLCEDQDAEAKRSSEVQLDWYLVASACFWLLHQLWSLGFSMLEERRRG